MTSPRYSGWLWLVLWTAAVSAAAAQPKAGSGPGAESQRRAAERQTRGALAKSYADELKKAETPYLNSLGDAVRWLTGLQAKAEAEQLVAEIEKVNPGYLNLSQLKSMVAGLAPVKELDAGGKKDLAARLKAAARNRAGGLLGFARTCYSAGFTGYAYDLATEALADDPDDAAARRAMGHSKVGETWCTAFEATQVQMGKSYVKGLGWAPKDGLERIKNGEWFDANKWAPLADADKAHAALASPWEIETDNFTLRATTGRKQAMVIAERLERIRQFCFRQYLEFFLRGSSKQGAQLLFNQTAPKKMVVYYFGNKDDYDTYVLQNVKSQNKALILNSAGFYSPSSGASFFYHGEHYGPFLFNLMQHEVTHQILGEFSQGGCKTTWLTEGIATVLEHAVPLADGRLVLPRGLDHPEIVQTAQFLKQGRLPSLSQFLAMDHAAFHREPGRSDNYTIAGAFCLFVLDMKGRIYAPDFLEFLFDAYKKREAPDLTEYLGMDLAALDSDFKEYLKTGALAVK